MIAAEVETKRLNVKELVLDKNVQMRATINRTAVVDYAEAMEAGDEFPPIVVFFKLGDKKYVADGFHRVLAALKAGLKTILAEVRHGGKREAMLFAASANVRHGVRRTAEDKRKAVVSFLSDKEWKGWADTVIARMCVVSPAMVARYRSYMGEKAQPAPSEDGYTRVKFVDRHGEARERIVATPIEPKESKLEKQIGGEHCPYCGQKMPGRAHRIR